MCEWVLILKIIILKKNSKLSSKIIQTLQKCVLDK
jgi:hypothetical protein